MNWQAISAAIEAGKKRLIKEKASVQEEGELDLIPDDCHSNAEKFAKARGGEVVRGWLVGRHYYIPHSVVDLEGVLFEVTPVDRGLYDTCVFVAEGDVPDVVWNKMPAVIFHEQPSTVL